MRLTTITSALSIFLLASAAFAADVTPTIESLLDQGFEVKGFTGSWILLQKKSEIYACVIETDNNTKTWYTRGCFQRKS